MESAVKAAAKSYAASEKVPYEQLSAYGIHSRMKKVAGVDTLLETVEKEEAKGVKSSPASKKEAKLTKAFETAYKKAFKSMKGGFRRRSQTARFNRCVKKVRKTVKARKGSSKESAAIGICTKSVLHTRGRTLKSYSKKRLVTQKRK